MGRTGSGRESIPAAERPAPRLVTAPIPRPAPLRPIRSLESTEKTQAETKKSQGPYYFQWTSNPALEAAKASAMSALGGTPSSGLPPCKIFGPYDSMEECNLANIRWAGAAQGAWIATPCSLYRPFNCTSGGK